MSATVEAVVTVPGLKDKLKHLASGKVREVYEIDEEKLLFVATDRISAYDVIMENGIPTKGALLTSISQFWFQYLSKEIPSLKTHFVAPGIPSSLESSFPADTAAQLSRRSMQVRRLKPFAIESIVRGYITGSAWSEYKSKGTVHGIPMREGLQEGDKLDEPIWTPSTKAEVGGKDENLKPEEASSRTGISPEYIESIKSLSLALYSSAHAYAATRGIVIADTKFEFAPDPEATASHGIVLIDEVLTPDSSRFWPASTYKPGGAQESFDKQFLRDWLTKEGLKGKEGVKMTDEIVQKTREKYAEAYYMLTGEKWE